MSGSGGFYKYHCKYFLTYDCPNWVFVNNAPCADCCAAGRDADEDEPPVHAPPGLEISFPVFHDGQVHYTLVEVVVSTAPGSVFHTWTPRQAMPPPPAPPPSVAMANRHPDLY